MPTTPSLGRETLNLLTGRAANLLLSFGSLFLFPVLLGPQAHGLLQYYLGLYLLLLGYLNGCAAPMLSHFIAIYRVSDPPRQGVLIRQVFLWFAFATLSLWLVYPLLANPMGFAWIFLGVAAAGLSQVLSAAEYGLGWLGPATWFPVLLLFLRLVFVCGAAVWVVDRYGEERLLEFARDGIPVLLLLSALPPLVWMIVSFLRRRAEFFLPGQPLTHPSSTWFPWEEMRALGAASMAGQLIYQVFTRSLVPLAKQTGFPDEQVGYLGLSMQGFGLVIYLASIFSVSAYPWLVSAWEAKDKEGFGRLQSEVWRMSVLAGGWVVASMIGLARPMVWVVLGSQYRADIELLTVLIQTCAIAGALMLGAEFNLRMLQSVTQMGRYLCAILIGFAPVIPFLAWALLTKAGMATFSWALPLGVGCVMLASAVLAPKTQGYWRVSLLALVGGGLSIAAAKPFEAETFLGLLIQGMLLSLVYLTFAWIAGLAKSEDLRRLFRGIRPSIEGSVV